MSYLIGYPGSMLPGYGSPITNTISTASATIPPYHSHYYCHKYHLSQLISLPLSLQIPASSQPPSHIFCSHENMSQSEQCLTDTHKLAPYVVQVSGSYILCKLRYSKFCVEIRKLHRYFQFLFNQGITQESLRV